MSRRKQAKPQHINSEEGQGEQPLQQPSPDLAEAPAAEEPGECGCGPVRAPVCPCVPGGCSQHRRASLEGAGSGSRFWNGDSGLRSGKGETERTEGGSSIPPPHKSLPQFFLMVKLVPHFPSASLSLQLASPCPQSHNWFPSPRYTSTPPSPTPVT